MTATAPHAQFELMISVERVMTVSHPSEILVVKKSTVARSSSSSSGGGSDD